MPTTLNRRERKAAQLLKHYATCERLAIALGMDPSKADGKNISVALFKLEREAHKAMEHACSYLEPYWSNMFLGRYSFSETDEERKRFTHDIGRTLIWILGALPPGFFVNRDPRGYALKIDPENKLGALLIKDAGLHTDWGGYGVLSPMIDGN